MGAANTAHLIPVLEKLEKSPIELQMKSVQNRFLEQVRFDWITLKMLGEIGLFEPVPQTLGNLLKRF